MDNMNILQGRTGRDRTKLIWHFDALDGDGNYVDIGCCPLELEDDAESMAQEYQKTYGVKGLIATPTVWTAVQRKYKNSRRFPKDQWCMYQSNPATAASD